MYLSCKKLIYHLEIIRQLKMMYKRLKMSKKVYFYLVETFRVIFSKKLIKIVFKSPIKAGKTPK